MAQHQSFKHSKSKFNTLWDEIIRHKHEIQNIDTLTVIEIPITTLKKTNRFPLDTDVIYYDLYDFKGITYRSGGGNPPSPLECYTENPPGTWNFNLPIYDYRVPVDEDVEVFSGCPDWEFQSSIGNIKTILRFTRFSEDNIYNFDLLSYLYDEEGNVVESENFSQFYRWVKNGDGYDFIFHAFWTVPEDKQIFLKLNLLV